MLNNLKTYLFLLVFVLAQTIQAQEIPTAYQFRIKPGTDKWRTFTTHQQMVDVCQIPEDTLKLLSTKALLETCLSYPLRIDVFAYDNHVTGFNRTFQRFNGYIELVSRPDFSNELFRYYQNIRISEAETLPDLISKGGFSINLSLTEMFFGTAEFQKNTTINQKESVRILLSQYDFKKNYPDIYGSLGSVTTAYAIINLMSMDANTKEALKRDDFNLFKSQLIFTDDKLLLEIFSIAKTFIR